MKKLRQGWGVVLGMSILAGCSSSPKSGEKVDSSPPSGGSAYLGHGAHSVNPEQIARFTAPKLEPEVSRRIQMMLDIRAPAGGKLSADGKTLYFNWRVTGVSQVWRIGGPDKFPTQLTGGEDKTSLVGLTPDGQTLVVSRDRKGEENPGLYTQPANGGELTVIQHKPGIQTFADYITNDSKTLYFHSNDIKPDSYAIYAYDFKTRAISKIWEKEGLWSIADIDEKQGLALLEKTTGSLWSEFYLWDLHSAEAKPLIGQGEQEEYVVQFGAKPGEYLVQTNKLGEFRRLYHLRDGKLTAISPEMKADVSSFRIDFPRKTVYYEINEGGYTRLKAMDAATFKDVKVPTFTGADHVYVSSITRDGRYVSLEVETAQSPRASMVWDRETQQKTRWVYPSAPETDLKHFVAAKLESYTARDGTSIPMFVRRPNQCGSGGEKGNLCPVVVHFHGGPESQTQPGFSPFAQLFVDAGFVFVEPNVRGSDGYGRKWIESDNGAKRLNVITDIEDAALYIKKTWARGGVKPRVGVMGWSYGGYSTLYAMTRFAGAFDAGVASVGMSNLVTFLENTAPYRRKLRITEYGDPVKDHDALVELSPITHLDKIKSPLMIIQGVSDPRVPAGEALQIQKALEKKGLPHQLILFADEGHGAAKRENQVLEWGHMLRFFEKNLKSSDIFASSSAP